MKTVGPKFDPNSTLRILLISATNLKLGCEFIIMLPPYINRHYIKKLCLYNTSRKMPNEVASGFHTTVMHACVPEAVGIAKVLRLPPPIPLPQVRLGKTPTTSASGPEVA